MNYINLLYDNVYFVRKGQCVLLYAKSKPMNQCQKPRQKPAKNPNKNLSERSELRQKPPPKTS
jgi:hypothetical protein